MKPFTTIFLLFFYFCSYGFGPDPIYSQQMVEKRQFSQLARQADTENLTILKEELEVNMKIDKSKSL